MPFNARQFQRLNTLFDGSSGQSSTLTSSSHYVGDFGQLSLSWHSSGATSNLTIWGTNEDGFRSSIGTWSAVTTLPTQGIYAIEAGMRWLRVTRGSADSLSQVFLQCRT